MDLQTEDAIINELLNLEISIPSKEQIEDIFHDYDIEFTDYAIINYTWEMINVIDNIKNFSCSYSNLIRKTQNYFTNFVHLFLYKCLILLFTGPFHLEIILTLLESLNHPHLLQPIFFSLIVFNYERLDFLQIANFLEVLKIRKLINNDSYEVIYNFISQSNNPNYINFIHKIESPQRNTEIARAALKLKIEHKKNSKESEEEEDDDEEELINDDQNQFKKIRYEMIHFKKGYKGNRYSPETYKFAFLLFHHSKVSYDLIRQVFCLPCEKSVRLYFDSFIKKIDESIFDSEKIEDLIEVQNVPNELPFDCNCAIDAAVFKPILGSEVKKIFPFIKDIEEGELYSSIFTYYIEPISPYIRPFSVHLEIKKNGFADEKIELCKKDIIEKLKENNINCIFVSSDGDKFYDDMHEKAYHEYKHLIEEGKPFAEIADVVKSHSPDNPWPLSDPFHSTKSVRSQILLREIALTIFDKYDINELDKIIQNKNVIKDKTSLGSMKDSYPLTLFGFDSFINSIQYKESHFLITPFFLYLEAIRNNKLSKETRKKYLETSFLFLNYFLHMIGYTKTVGTRICIIRIMNTIIGIYSCIDRDAFHLANLGTHPLECFYGNVRIDCHFFHSLFNVVHSISKAILSNHLIEELHLKRKIKGRKNIGGAKVEKDSKNQYGYLPFSPHEFFIIFLKDLYSLKNDQILNLKMKEWYDYLIKNHSPDDDCEVYIQGKLAGCNIMARNIAVSEENKNPIQKVVKINQNNEKRKYFKYKYLKQHTLSINLAVCSSLDEIIKETKDKNSFIIINNFFGNILEKGQQISKKNNPCILMNILTKYEKLERKQMSHEKQLLLETVDELDERTSKGLSNNTKE